MSYCNTCKGDRIFDETSTFCVCPEGLYDDYISENCVGIIYNFTYTK